MLSDKLEKTSRAEAKATARRLAALTGVLAVLGLALLGVIKIDLTPFGPDEAAAPERKPAEYMVPDSSVASIGASGPKSAEPNLDDPKRLEAKALIAKLRSEVLGGARNPNFRAWAPGAAAEIETAYHNAISALTASDYSASIGIASAALSLGTAKLEAFEAAFLTEIERARRAFESDDFPAAEQAISRAMALRPEDGNALALNERIQALPEQLSLIKASNVARVENDLSAERDHLSALMELAPNRTSHAERLQAVEREIKELDFSALIDQAYLALDKRDAGTARRRLEQSERIFKGRAVTEKLKARVASLERELTGLSFLRKARAAVEADDWVGAEKFYARSIEFLGGGKESTEGRERAARIIRIEGLMDRHLAAPVRLGSANVAGVVSSLLDDAAELSVHSPRLTEKAKSLGNSLKAYTTEVPVRVRSDQKTYIKVRGVGVVGKTADRIIRLRPGRHVFEGRCPGYKSVSVEVDVPPKSTSTVVEVRCREKV